MHTVINGLLSAVCIPHGLRRSRSLVSGLDVRGFTLLETMVAACITMVLAAVTIPAISTAAEDIRTAGAARYLATRLQQLRSESIARSVDVGWVFGTDGTGYWYREYVDRNANGIRTEEIRSGTDLGSKYVERLGDRYAGVEFGASPDLPSVDGNETVGADPIKMGAGNILTFSPLGTSSSGTLYIRGPGNRQFAVCVLGGTGRIRVLRFDTRSRRWNAA
jgi:type II secretory pathway pseudopilin PulG